MIPNALSNPFVWVFGNLLEMVTLQKSPPFFFFTLIVSCMLAKSKESLIMVHNTLCLRLYTCRF
jgi:uncharacterized membrane protein